MPASVELTQVEKNKVEIHPDIDFRAMAERPFEQWTPNEIGMFKWSGVYHQLQKGHFMIRLRIPGGRLTAAQFRRAGELADIHARGQLCITTRQCLQFHWVKPQDIYKIIEGMADVGVLTTNACGDVCRNVVGCPSQGTCPHEIGDSSRMLQRIADDPELLREKRNLPRKHKIAVAGCGAACGYALMNCQGWHPVTRTRPDGTTETGWRFHAGGGLGSLPHLGKVIFDWVPDDLVLHVTRAAVEAHNRYGNRRKRRFARLKIIVDQMGAHAFGRLLIDLMRERNVRRLDELVFPESPEPDIQPDPFACCPVVPECGEGRRTVRVLVPRSELSTDDAAKLTDLADRFGDGSVVFTQRQNVQFPSVPEARVDELLAALRACGFRTEGFEQLPDVVACVGTTLCNLAVSDTPEAYRLITTAFQDDEAFWREIGPLRINMNGCPNSCGHHWIADIGLRGRRSRTDTGSEEGFTITIGGRLDGPGAIGEPVADVSLDEVVPTLRSILGTYLRNRLSPGETFGDYVHRIGAPAVAGALAESAGRPRPATPALGGLSDSRPVGVPAPYDHNALSKLAGQSAGAKDMHWLAENIPCQHECPAATDIPAYLTAVYEGRNADAYRINLRDNVFPGVLGRVCARPCEAVCRHGWEGLGDPVAICHSKRAGADLREDAEPVVLERLFGDSGKTVAVIGAGVAGLTAARNLALLGHAVTVYEKHPEPGGMMVQGIPVFRLPRDVVKREIEQIRRLGVRIECGVTVGKDVPLSRLLTDNDAVVMAAGTLRPNMLDLPGKDLDGIRHGLDFLLEVNDTGDAAIGPNVIVIGGGFTAMDCARTARRLGAKLATKVEQWQDTSLTDAPVDVRVLYRRSVNEMLVTPGEIDELGHEGIPLEEQASPVAYIGEDGHVRAVRFIRTELGEPDASGRRRPVPICGSEFELPADLVLLATGQFPESSWIDADLRDGLVAEDGWLENGSGFRTAHEKLFVAGDFATGARSLIDAIGHAKSCVPAVDTVLMGRARLADVAVIEDDQATGRIPEMDHVGLQTMPAIADSARAMTTEVETGYDHSLSVDEAQRCYRCHYKYEIDPDRCIYCDWCIKAKPRPECIVRARNLRHGATGEILGYEPAETPEDTRLIHINQTDCIRCNACVDACPVDAISIQKVSRAVRACGQVCASGRV